MRRRHLAADGSAARLNHPVRIDGRPYVAGALVHLRQLPAWLHGFVRLRIPYLPFPIAAAAVIAVAAHLGLMRTADGAILRRIGGNPLAIQRADWSPVRAKMTIYTLVGSLDVLAGMALVGASTSADANMANGYTLLSIAGAILGGAEFTGGRASPIGAAIGAPTLPLAAVALNFFHLSVVSHP